MSYTNSTTNYGLPQWIAADKPKFLTDINNAYDTIDTQLKNANDNANTASDNATSALSIAGQAATTAESAATVAGQAAALAQSVNELVGTINAKIGTTSIATIGDGTVTGAIDEIYSNLADYLHAETKVLTVASIIANGSAETSADVSITGYTAIGVVGNNQSLTGGLAITSSTLNQSAQLAYLQMYNHTSTAFTDVQVSVLVLYVKNMS